VLKKLLIGLLVLTALGAAYVATRPAAYHVERSVTINAPADVVWANVSDFNQWHAWNPWQKSDLAQTVTIAGAKGSPGHSSAWDGEKTGKGIMTVLKADAPSQLTIKLEFEVPMESVAMTQFAFSPKGSGVKVTWSMDGENDFVGKAFDVLMDVENMIGKSYDSGLSNLKSIAEAKAKEQ
jgi:hypothetical protein